MTILGDGQKANCQQQAHQTIANHLLQPRLPAGGTPLLLVIFGGIDIPLELSEEVGFGHFQGNGEARERRLVGHLSHGCPQFRL
ncbi:MAG: hypothetical protein ACK55I_36280, partial [bacterium]